MTQPFITNLVFSILCEGVFTDQYEEQLRLVFAADEQDAVSIARDMGAKEEGKFVDRHGRIIGWNFIAVKDVTAVQLEQGALLHSSIKEMQPFSMID
jgi:hypothetical protein